MRAKTNQQGSIMWNDDLSRPTRRTRPLPASLWRRTNPAIVRSWERRELSHSADFAGVNGEGDVGTTARPRTDAAGRPTTVGRAAPQGTATPAPAALKPFIVPQPPAAPVQLPPADVEHTTPHLRFAIQPIVTRHGNVAGHELLFRWNSADAPVQPSLGAYATASALSHALIDGQLLTRDPQGRPIGTLYVNMDERFLLSPMAEVMTPDLGVIELLETVSPTDDVQKRVQALHQRGYRFSLDDVESTDDPRWVLAEYVESVKIDVRATPPDQIQPIIKLARAAGLIVVAEKVETPEQIEELARLGAQLFQGYAVQRPILTEVPPLPGCRTQVLGVLHQMMADGAGPEALSMVAATDPALVARLLRLQALHAPREVALSQDLAQVLESLARPVLAGWLTQWLIAAQHVRGQDAVAGVSRQLARYQGELAASGMVVGAERRTRLFGRYRELVQAL